MPYPLIIAILLLTVGQMGWHLLTLRKEKKVMTANQAVLATLTKSLYTYLMALAGPEKGQQLMSRVLQSAKDSLKEDYGIYLEKLEIREKDEEEK